jgi:hypothetical protein
MPTSAEYDIALAVFNRIKAAFPHLTMQVGPSSEFFEISVHIPAQPGLLFDVDLNLQNRDELHLVAESLWVEWFPCTRSEVADDYFDAVVGLISGRYRIEQHWRGANVVKAELQRPAHGAWATIATWSKLALPFPRKHFEVVQNHAAA